MFFLAKVAKFNSHEIFDGDFFAKINYHKNAKNLLKIFTENKFCRK